MGLFNINKGGTVESPKKGGVLGSLIQMDANSNDVLMWKFPANDIVKGAVIKVHQNQRALLYSSGKRIETIGPGREVVVDSANIPVLKNLLNIAHGGETSYPFEVWFANMTCERNVKIGITTEDGVLFSTINEYTKRSISFPITAYGSYRFKLHNPEIYCDKLVGTTKLSSTADVSSSFEHQIKVIMIEETKNAINRADITIDNILGASRALNATIRANTNEEIKQQYGIELTSFNIIFNSPAYQNYLKAGREGAEKENRLGNMGNFYDKENQYDIMKKAASNQGAGNFMGVGMGFGMGNTMGQMMGQMAQNMNAQGMAGMNNNMGQAAPPPIPGTKKFYFAVNGQSVGPLDMASIQMQIAQQAIAPNTLAWTEGMAQWQAAATIPELASMFAPTPPPIPTSL